MTHQTASWPGLSRPSTSYLLQESRGCPRRQVYAARASLAASAGMTGGDAMPDTTGLQNERKGRYVMRRLANILLPITMLLAMPSPSHADPIADFYRGKTLRMLIGYGPGGGYDIYGRLVAELLPRHIPGNPMIVPQNMSGGGSFVAAKFMA